MGSLEVGFDVIWGYYIYMQFNSFSLDDTAALARRLAPSLVAGDCVLLHGAVGAGKSAFARALIDARLCALGRAEDIPSPSFALLQTYDLSECELFHVDLYRLNSLGELDELGLDMAFDTAITVIEWAEKLGEFAPQDALHIHIDITADDSRILRFVAQGTRGKALLKGLAS